MAQDEAFPMSVRSRLAKLLWGDRRFVLSLYRILLRRDPDPEGFRGWLAHLRAHPADRELVIERFLDSDEFRARWGLDLRARHPGATSEGLARKEANAYHEAQASRELATFLAGDETLGFQPGAAPPVSVIVVHYGNVALTFATLASLRASTRIDLDLIVVDNDGGMRASGLSTRLDGALVVAPEENLGFVRGSNAGAARARSPRLLFLNNDVRVQSGAVESALRTMEEEEAGVVVGKLLHFHGLLQEAGALVWSDGSTEAYGRGGDPDAGEYCFRRDVDYGSGAFFLTTRRLFDELAGFDEAFSPGYYEEVDYCFRLRQKGRRVVYEPRSVVWHWEGGSFAVETSREVTLRNRALFAARHAESLRTRPAPGCERHLACRLAARRMPLALVVDDRAPDPQFGAGHGRMLEIVLALRQQGYQVCLYGTEAAPTEWHRAARYLPPDVELIGDRGAARLQAFLALRIPFVDLLVASRHNNMESVERFLAEHSEVRRPPIVFDMESMPGEREALRSALLGGIRRSTDIASLPPAAADVALARRADSVLVASDRDLQTLRGNGISSSFVIRHVVDSAAVPPPRHGRKGLLFVGAFHADDTPNADSMQWFVGEVLPRLQRLPGGPIPLTVAGFRRPGALLPWTSRDGVRFLGRQDDLRELYATSLVFVAPTRFAAGIPIKVLEAAAHGLPAVVSDVLGRQLGWTPDKEIVVGPSDDPDGFSLALQRLLDDEALWGRVQAGALHRVSREASRESFRLNLRYAVRTARERADARGAGAGPRRGDAEP